MKGVKKFLCIQPLSVTPRCDPHYSTVTQQPNDTGDSPLLEVQFQDIVIEIVHTNTIVGHTSRELGGTVHYIYTC